MEDYKKKYEDALERAKEELGSGCFNKGSIEYIFPELKEDNDERIRKHLISLVKNWDKDGIVSKYTSNANDIKQILAWLEKQGNPTDKVEPKFKVGDWVVQGNRVYKVVEICESWYEVIDGEDNHFSISFDNEHMCRLWEISKDAKDGDVLQLGEVTAIFKKYIGDGNCKCYCSVYDGEFEIPNTDNSYGCHNAVPATKEQRELLFKKMAENGYAWNPTTKELSHQEVTKKSEQEVLTEKDIKMIDILCCIFEVSDTYYKVDRQGQYAISSKEILDWLKSFKRKLQ